MVIAAILRPYAWLSRSRVYLARRHSRCNGRSRREGLRLVLDLLASVAIGLGLLAWWVARNHKEDEDA